MTPPEDPRSAAPDALVIASINAGRHEDFEVLYRRYEGWVFRLALRFTGDHETAADVTQETFIYLLRRLPTLRLHARLTTFLYPAVRNLAINAARRERRGRGAADQGAGPPGTPRLRLVGGERGDEAGAAGGGRDPAGPPDPAAGERRAALDAAVRALPEGQREVLLMRIVDEMSVSDIAAALGIPSGTVKSRLHHALAALRDDPRTRAYFGE